ncbi:MAG: DnaA/Hda family protein [Planctomycetota bacterium]|nr:DnaA/Hda family protein [Planctomycetota bacterium]
MTKHDREIVPDLRAALAARIGADRFELWFGNRVQFELRGRTLRVTAADRFFVDRIRSQFRSDLTAACAELLPGHLEIEFHIDSSLAPAPSKPHLTIAGDDARRVRRETPVPPGPAREPGRPRSGATLEAFVVGDCNRLAYTAAQSMIRRPGQVSPLFVYGPTGCGKTYLLEGIAATARQNRNIRRVLSLSSEQFTSHFLEALRGSGLPNFRRKYRDVELLLLDDVQFFCGKRATVVEVQYTVDALLREGRQLVLAADRPPAELSGLGQELVARISGGLVCGIESPDEATRLNIARGLAGRLDMAVPEEVLQFVAAQVVGDARQLAGALNRLQAASNALSRPISVALAETALTDIVRATRRIVRLPDIETAICDVFGIDSKSLQSGRKSKLLSQPRMLAMWLARKYTRAAFSEIGDYFGGRSHSTVISAQKKVASWMDDDAAIQLAHGQSPVRDAIRRVEARLRTG